MAQSPLIYYTAFACAVWPEIERNSGVHLGRKNEISLISASHARARIYTQAHARLFVWIYMIQRYTVRDARTL